MNGVGSAEELLREAHVVLEQTDPSTSGLWPRAAALLGRQALEDALAWVWLVHAAGVEACSMRAQLLCLPAYLDDPDLAEEAAHVYGRLSWACHHQPYDLAPTAEELTAWLREVDRVLSAADEVAKRPPGNAQWSS
jgi:hypothetical protein